MRQKALILEPRVDCPRLARASVEGWLAEEGQKDLVERVVLVVSELVTNAVVHARTPLKLSFDADQRSVEVGVSDEDRELPRVLRPLGTTLDDGSVPDAGRGLAMVEALTDEWGITETASGKRVWARWSLQDQPA